MGKSKKHQTKLIQTELNIGKSSRKTCKICGMSYIQTVENDNKEHKKFHQRSINGIEWPKSSILPSSENSSYCNTNSKTIKPNSYITLSDGSKAVILTVSKSSSIAERNAVNAILHIANTELNAVNVTIDATASNANSNTNINTNGSSNANVNAKLNNNANLLKAYVCILLSTRCLIGCVLVENMSDSYLQNSFWMDVSNSQLVNDDSLLNMINENSKNKKDIEIEKSINDNSIKSVIKSKPLIGISRIYTVRSWRRKGVASFLLDYARSEFIYGMITNCSLIAFTQPSFSGLSLAKKYSSITIPNGTTLVRVYNPV